MTKNQAIAELYSQLSGVVSNAYSKVGDKVLFKTEQGIVIYNRYVIFRTPSGIKLANRYGITEIMSFNTAKNALTWALLDMHDKIAEAKRVRELDTFLSSVEVDIQIHRRYLKTSDPEKFLIYYSKHQNDVRRQKQFLSEIDKYYILAQRCQQRGLKHETK
jgi:hypothetical protein